jgi:F-type H+-transporting ATPase subunit a
LNISLAAEPVLHIAGITITNSVLTAAILYIGLIGFAIYFSRQKLALVPASRSLQNVLEIVVDGLMGLFRSAAGEKARQFFPLAATFFVFILLGNWIGLLPGFGSIGIWKTINGEQELIPLFRGVTADINTTLALALISVGAIQYYGLKATGFHYLNKYINFKSPIYTFVGLLEILSEFAKIISFAFRLFGNIFAGEVLLTVISSLIPFLVNLPFYGLEIFVGFIQALVFVMLTLVLLKVATESQH